MDFLSRWQAEEYRNELVETVQREATLSPLDRAKELIDQYCQEEFSEGADFTDLTTIGIAFTTITDDEIPIQAYVDLVGFKLERYLGEVLIDVRQYDSLEALIAGELEELSFNDLTYASDEQIAAVLAQEVEQTDTSLAEQADQFETEQQDYRNQVLSGLTPDQQRVVAAMETAGFPFRPTETRPIYFGDLDDYPITFDSWDAAYEFINSTELKDTPGLREQVQAVLHPEAAFPYNVGDTVYLEDGKPFVIDSIGTSDVHLLDPSLRFPVLRAESRENFLRLMERYPQEQQAEQSPQQPTVTEEPVAFHPGEQNGLPFDVEVRTIHFDAPEQTAPAKEPATAEEPEPALAAEPEVSPDETVRGTPVSVQIGGEWRTFPDREAAEEALYADYKEQTHRNAQNFHITDDALGEGGPKAKYQANVAAIRLLQHLEADGLQASPEQQEVLSRYVGWGALSDAFDPNKTAWVQEYQELKSLLTEEEYAAARASTLNAHYTSPTVIKAIYEAVGNMGFQTGNILEPSMGMGNFFGLLPKAMQDSKLYGIELDSLTGRIARQLYPHADIKVAGFETTDRRDFYDLAVGNVPFGDYKVNDKPYNKLGFSIHNYFFAKALDQVRPGGVVAFVTSRYTMDAKSPEVRKYLAQRAELLGAIRLPNNAFRANAGTDVVSDILFLQKRESPIDIEPDWVHLGQTPEGFAINSYFVDHPEMVMGELTSQSTQYGHEECTVAPIPGADLAEQLHGAVSHIHGHYQAAVLEAEEVDVADGPQSIPADPNVKNFSYTVVDGEVYFRENSVIRPVELNDKARGRVTGLVLLRQIVNELIEYQMEDYPEEDIVAKQRELNAAYDSFMAQYGLINSRGNAQAFADDSSYYLLCSLENLDEDGKFVGKADMFTKRTIRPERKITSVDTPSEALAVSIGERGKVDLPFMAELLGTPGEYDRITNELSGVIFKDPLAAEGPEQGWQTADEYLSGNVRDKLRVAKLAAETDSQFAVNVTALEKAQPKDLDASEIDVRLGATWVDKDYIQQFMYEIFETPFYMRRSIEVKFSPLTAEWQITGKTVLNRHDVAAYVTYGTDRANAYRILEETLNLKDIRIYDTVEDADGKQKRVLNKKETTLAQQKQQAIKDAFQDWVWKDPRRREALCKKYNELFNSTRPREYDGSHIHFVGMNPEITLREHQKNAIAHVLYGGNTLLAHEVGAGKTFEMAAAAMESKRLGLCQKSLFVVPNHLTTQWANEFLRLYPSAKILVATRKDFETARRKKFCARIATGDYDAVIIGHSQFEKIPVSAERQERLLQEQIDDIEEAIAIAKYQRGENFTIKQMEKTRRSLQARLDKLTSTERKDDV
ncbi:MAG: DEAD/DEAH box helicase family protein, partial [Clostridiales bacterium]|nr:DEAD/DEAH box helicase family protein [Clostridiales bacterium]